MKVFALQMEVVLYVTPLPGVWETLGLWATQAAAVRELKHLKDIYWAAGKQRQLRIQEFEVMAEKGGIAP